MSKIYPVIGCCGIACGLCPRYYTAGVSKCPGCGGAGFEDKHPPCFVKTCCAEKNGLEVCSQCAGFPCLKYEDREKIERDSFVTHKRIFPNHEEVKAESLDAFIGRLNERVSVLEEMLAKYDDGRSKSFYCLAAALLSVEALRGALAGAARTQGDCKTKARALRADLNILADGENIQLRLDA